jgi:hypothetical protein
MTVRALFAFTALCQPGMKALTSMFEDFLFQDFQSALPEPLSVNPDFSTTLYRKLAVHWRIRVANKGANSLMSVL